MKRLLSLVIVVTMLLGVAPTASAARDNANDNRNDAASPTEPWTYVADQTIPSLLESNGGSSSDIVRVRVTAIDKSTEKQVDVHGATVNLYVGSKLRDSVDDDDNDGIVEISLAGLSFVERMNATISANKIVSRGKAINGTARDDLFEHFPTDKGGEYYRYTLELHSETIDSKGHWKGAEIPAGKESNKVDIVFIIDATGSMADEINNVRTNIASFSENLIKSGLDIRFCIIDYRDITEIPYSSIEETHVHTISGSHWMKDIDSVVNTLASIEAEGGGDGPETVIDPLGYVADNSLMSWRSDAYRFAFVLTDADHKPDNNYGYANLQEVTDKLAEMEVVTSVICDEDYDDYTYLYETTGGICADIYSSNFDKEMMDLSDSIIDSVIREMTLTLREPRLLVNMSVCYLANDSTSQSSSYEESVKKMLSEYAQRLAEATDGHILIDHILLFSTGNLINFYTTSNIASMADIRIETTEGDSATIHSNAAANGFFTASSRWENISDTFPQFKHVSDDLKIRASFWRIQMSGTEGAGWDNSMIDDRHAYSTTVMHETGHYLIGLFDEYMNENAENWRDVGNKPYKAFGLMDNQHDDIEMSKNGIDYVYIASNNVPTYHWKVFKQSTEDTLADLLVTGNNAYDSTQNTFRRWEENTSTGTFEWVNHRFTYYDFPDGSVFDDTGEDEEYGRYVINYSKAAKDRKAKYPYAELSDDDFLSPYSKGGHSDTVYADGDAESAFTSEALADVSFTGKENAVTISVSGDVSVGIMKADDEKFVNVALTSGTADLPIAKGELAEIRITSADGAFYNTYYIDRSAETNTGYMYSSADNAVMAYVTTDELSSYTFIADNTGYTNGEYRSVNQATWISSDNGAGFNSGEIYSVADYLAEIDYTTLSWFKYADGEWTAIATDYSEEENMNIGARADLDGEGMYVLMAKEAPVGGVQPARNLNYTQSTDLDAVVTLTFDDPNTDSRYYNVYYAEKEFTDKNAEGVVVRSFDANASSLTIDLLERGRTVYAAVEIVAEDGRRSELSEIILIGGEADSDGDGIPDWYCDKYLLWGEEGEDKDIANSDDDGDGLTNLEEYQGGSDPTDPNDPVHTTNVPVESVTVSKTELTLNVGDAAEVTATVMPENATNKNVTWTSEDTGVATVTVKGDVCTVTAVAEGTTRVYAVTADGGFSAAVNVTVNSSLYGVDISRVYGDDRVKTAIEIAEQLKKALGKETFDTIIIANGDNFADALTGSYLANSKGAPILLYRASGVKLNQEYILDNLSGSGTVYILGGTAAVPADVESGLKDAGIHVKRLYGNTRFATNLKILEEAGVADEEILICTGWEYADSLSASAAGLPILMVNTKLGELTADQVKFLQNHTDSDYTIIGGTAAVSKELETMIEEIVGSVDRIYGNGREETSVAVANRYFEDSECIILAYSRNFPDGLCGGPLANAMGAPLILVNKGQEGYAAGYVAVNQVAKGYILGGTAVVPDAVVEKVFDKTRGDLVSLSVERGPHRKCNETGKSVDVDGLVLKAVYESGDPIYITGGYQYDKSSLSEGGTKTIAVSVFGMETSFDVEVLDFFSYEAEISAIDSDEDKTVGYNQNGEPVKWVLYITARYTGNWVDDTISSNIPLSPCELKSFSDEWKKAKAGVGGFWSYGCMDAGFGDYHAGRAFVLPDDPELAGIYSVQIVFGDLEKTATFTLEYRGNYTTGSGWAISNISWT